MSFGSPIIGSGGELVRDSIRSRNYQAGISGWIIRRDGTAEFVNVVIVGGELLITDPDGSFVRIYDQNPGQGALIELNPADVVGHTIDSPAELFTTSSASGAHVVVVGPEFDGTSGPTLFLGVSGSDVVADLTADQLISLESDQVRISNANNTPGLDIYPMQSPNRTRLELDGKILGFNCNGTTMLTPPTTTTTSATFANIAGASTFSFTKRHDETVLLASQSHAGFAAGGTGARVEYGLNFSGGVGNFAIGRINYSELSVDTPGASQRILTGINAGTYTVSLCWRRESGTSTVTLNSAVSSISASLQEVIEP